MGARAYIIRRILYMIPLFLGISIAVFLMMYAAGDPRQLILRGNPRLQQNPELFNEILAYYGFDKPIYEQYFNWLVKFLQLDLGKSTFGGIPVNLTVKAWLFSTVELQLVAIAIALPVATYLGILSARKQYSKIDMATTTVSLFGISIPTFWFGIILILIFSFYLGLLPSAGAYGHVRIWPSLKPVEEASQIELIMDHLYHLILPSLVLAYANLAVYVRVIRANMLEVLRQDYILAARASGIPERKILYSHAFRNAFSPVLSLLGLYFGFILSGAPVTETVFSWPGLGRYYVAATQILDYPVIMGITMLIVILVLVANLLTDLLYVIVDPRVRIE